MTTDILTLPRAVSYQVKILQSHLAAEFIEYNHYSIYYYKTTVNFSLARGHHFSRALGLSHTTGRKRSYKSRDSQKSVR